MAVTLNANTSTGFVATSDLTGALTLQTAGNSALHITNTQNIGIGTTSPDYPLHIVNSVANKELVFLKGSNTNTGTGLAGEGPLAFQNSNNTVGNMAAISNIDAAGYINSQINFVNTDQSGGGAIAFTTRTNGGGSYAERVRIDQNGLLLAGVSSPLVNYCHSFVNNTTNGNSPQLIVRNAQSTAGRYWKIGATADASPYMIIYHATDSGVYMAYGSTSWSSSSDERLKDIIEPITDGLNKVSQLRTVIGKFKSDEEGTRKAFLIAQDVQAVLPEAVNTDPNGNLGLQYQDMIPLLVNSIQELKAIVDAQATEIAELKTKVGP